MKTQIFAASVALFLCTTPLNSSFSEKKDQVKLTIHDLSTQTDRKLIGDSIGTRKISELKRLGIFPLLIHVQNKADHSYMLSAHSISVPVLSIGDMALKLPVDKREDIWIALGALGAEIAAICALFPLFPDRELGDWTKYVTKAPGYRVPLSLITSGALFYLMVKGFVRVTNSAQNRKKDQISWMNEYLLSSGGITIYPSSEAQRYIFLDKASYESGQFTLALQDTNGDLLSFNVNILP